MNRRAFLTVVGGVVPAAVVGCAAQADHSGSPSKSASAVFEVTKTDAEWRTILTPAQFSILRDHETERPGSSPLNDEHRDGTYRCVGCRLSVYSSAAKFESGTGWPSFTASLPNAIGTSEDRSLFAARTEVHCRRCGGHLGHVFNDGPAPTGMRHCMNGAALTFVPTSSGDES